MDKLANNDKRYIREKLTKISEQIICKKPRAQIIAAYSRLIKRMRGIAEKNETICFEVCCNIEKNLIVVLKYCILNYSIVLILIFGNESIIT